MTQMPQRILFADSQSNGHLSQTATHHTLTYSQKGSPQVKLKCFMQ